MSDGSSEKLERKGFLPKGQVAQDMCLTGTPRPLHLLPFAPSCHSTPGAGRTELGIEAACHTPGTRGWPPG